MSANWTLKHQQSGQTPYGYTENIQTLNSPDGLAKQVSSQSLKSIVKQKSPEKHTSTILSKVDDTGEGAQRADQVQVEHLNIEAV